MKTAGKARIIEDSHGAVRIGAAGEARTGRSCNCVERSGRIGGDCRGDDWMGEECHGRNGKARIGSEANGNAGIGLAGVDRIGSVRSVVVLHGWAGLDWKGRVGLGLGGRIGWVTTGEDRRGMAWQDWRGWER